MRSITCRTPTTAAERAHTTELHRGVLGEQVDDVVPHLAIDVVAIGVLQVANRIFVVEAIDLLQSCRERLLACVAQRRRAAEWARRIHRS